MEEEHGVAQAPGRTSPIHRPIFQSIGSPITRVLLSRRARRTAVGRRAYAAIYLFGKRLAERPERRIFERHLRPGMTVIDAGANVGFYSGLCAGLVGGGGHVVAFEPDPYCSRILGERFAQGPGAVVRVERAALGDSADERTLYCSRRDRAQNRLYPFDERVPNDVVRVDGTTIDAYCRKQTLERVDAVKIDVEGGELAVLRGMRRTAAKRAPYWMLVEFSPGQLRASGESPEAFWSTLSEYGYSSHAIGADGRLRRIHDTAGFTAVHGERDTNVWAVHRNAPPPG